MTKLWSERGVSLEQGLTDDETAYIEADYGFRFPPDLKALLQRAQPTSHGFIDWRNTGSAGLRGMLAEPMEGVLDDVRDGRLWLPDWGVRPDDAAMAHEAAQRWLHDAPTLIPFWGGIYIPDDPSIEGNPLFIVHRGDIVFIAETLYALATKTRAGRWFSAIDVPMRHIRFWSDIAS